MAEATNAVRNDDQIAAVESEDSTAEEPQPTEATRAELPLDVKFDILKNRRRRLVLKELRRSDGEAAIGDLAEHIAAIENDISERALNAQQRKRVYIGLYQCHLPKMDDAGVVDFEQSRGKVELTPEADDLFEYMNRSTEEEEETDHVTPSHAALLAATVGVGGLFGITQFFEYYLVASLVVFAFLGGVIVYTTSTGTEDEE